MSDEQDTEPVFDPGFLERAFDAGTVKGVPGESKGLSREQVSFVVDSQSCAKGAFAEDFKLTLAALTPNLEVEAARVAKGDAAVMGMHMAQLSLYAVNGALISKKLGMREWLWKALGPKMRNVVCGIFAEKFQMVSDDAQGKAEATITHH